MAAAAIRANTNVASPARRRAPSRSRWSVSRWLSTRIDAVLHSGGDDVRDVELHRDAALEQVHGDDHEAPLGSMADEQRLEARERARDDAHVLSFAQVLVRPHRRARLQHANGAVDP